MKVSGNVHPLLKVSSSASHFSLPFKTSFFILLQVFSLFVIYLVWYLCEGASEGPWGCVSYECVQEGMSEHVCACI